MTLGRPSDYADGGVGAVDPQERPVGEVGIVTLVAPMGQWWVFATADPCSTVARCRQWFLAIFSNVQSTRASPLGWIVGVAAERPASDLPQAPL